MGNNCCQFPQSSQYQGQSQHGRVSVGTLAESLRGGGTSTARRTALPVCASMNPVMPSNQEGRNTHRIYNEQITRPQKVEQIQPLVQQSELVTIAGGENNEADESSHTAKSDENEKATSSCNLEPDACKESKTSNFFLLDATENEDFCSTCLDGYDEENPKILTKCKHHYHLACILEWKKRSNTCPMCGQVMIFEEKKMLIIA